MTSRLDPALLEALVDDAAVFPPGLAPLARAVGEHVARSAYRRYVGRLLVPATAVPELLTLADGSHVRVGLIARPGDPPEPVRHGLGLLADSTIEVAGVEVGADADWAALVAAGRDLTVELPRPRLEDTLDAVADAHHAQAPEALVQAKFRTGETDRWAWPDEAELAGVLVACVERRVPLKLTGGLHHAVRADHAVGGPQHGLLNVLAGVRDALDGAGADEVAELLRERDPAPLATALLALDRTRAAEIRVAFTAYGCCDVLDPVTELVALGLIDEEL